MSSAPSKSKAGPLRLTSIRRIALVSALVGGGVLLIILVASGRASRLVTALLHMARELGAGAIPLLVGAEALAFIFMLPISPLHVGMGVLYGLRGGVPLAWASYTLGCVVPFVLVRRSRTVAEGVGHLRRHELIDGVLAALEHEPIKLIACLRLSPLLPSTINSYALGLSSVRLSAYVVASSVGCIPNVVAQVYAGSLLDTLAEAHGPHGNGPVSWVPLLLGLFVTALLVVYVSRVATRRIEAARARSAADSDAHSGRRSEGFGDAGGPTLVGRWRGAPPSDSSLEEPLLNSISVS